MDEITVTLSDGRELVANVGMPDTVHFERKYDRPASDLEGAGEDTPVEWVLYLCFAALVRQDDVDGERRNDDDFLAFVDSVVDIDAPEQVADDPS